MPLTGKRQTALSSSQPLPRKYHGNLGKGLDQCFSFLFNVAALAADTVVPSRRPPLLSDWGLSLFEAVLT